ncbi:MAG: extracellular solute-binding protein, partial [Chloroflexota bacterium]
MTTKKLLQGILSGLIFLTVGIVACAPQSAPATSVPTPAASASVSVPASNLPPLTSQDAAWAKVIEAAKKEGKVSIYSYNLVGDIGLTVAKAFKDRFGITVDIITGRGAEILERVKTEKRLDKLTADIHDGTPVFAIAMKTEGLTVGLADQLPVFRETGVWRASVFGIDTTDKHVAAMTLQYRGPWINTREVMPKDVPEAWRELLKPQWKGKMMLTDPTTSGGPQQVFVPMIREKIIDDNYLIALYQQDLLFSSSSQDEGRMLARGERAISILASSATYFRYVAEGAPIKAIDMKDGVVLVLGPGMVAFNGGPHPNATKLFFNWFFSSDGQAVWTKIA